MTIDCGALRKARQLRQVRRHGVVVVVVVTMMGSKKWCLRATTFDDYLVKVPNCRQLFGGKRRDGKRREDNKRKGGKRREHKRRRETREE